MTNNSVPFLLDRLDENAASLKDAVAVSDGTISLTWKTLRAAAVSIALKLVELPVRDAPVAVVAERRSETLAMFYAVLYSGGFYLPLDPEMPSARLEQIRRNSEFRIVLGCGERPEGFEQDVWLDCAPFCREPLRIPQDLSLLSERRASLSDESPLYLVYTSGSTGVPKGVLKQYGSMRSFAEAFLREYPIESYDVLGNQTPFFFDASAKDIYWSLVSGCRLEIIPTKLFSFPVQLLEYLNEKEITVISWVPSALSIAAQLDAFSCVVPNKLRMVFFVGEVMPAKHLARWQTALPDTLFVNLYGSSEIAGVCCHCRIDRIYGAEESLPLGRPFSHCKLTLRGENGPVTDVGEEGELLVESSALALCYYKDPERSKEVFQSDGSIRRLHTGDMAMYREDGLLVFTTRRDFQIKHMGYRIELGEIEAAACALDGAAAAGCIFDRRKDRIVLYLEPQPGQEMTSSQISTELRKTLCAYMLPQRVFVLEQLPRNRNGKIDRPALQHLYEETGARRPRHAK